MRTLQVSLAFIVLAPVAASFAETGQLETTGGWFLDPVLQNWTCSVAPGKLAPTQCTGYIPQKNNFVAVRPVVVQKLSGSTPVNKYYFYVNTWAQAAGPLSECSGDNIGVFEAPYTAAGAKGSGLIYRGTVRPCDGNHWGLGSAFYDASLASVFVTAGKNPSGGQAGGEEHKEIWVGTSPDVSGYRDGLNFTWSLLLSTSSPTLRVIRVVAQPEPGQSKRWWGFLQFDTTSDNLGIKSAPFRVDWRPGVMTYSYRTSSTAWKTKPIGSAITDADLVVAPLYAAPFSAPVTDFRLVGSRWEAWFAGDRTLSPGGSVPRSGNPPCSPSTALYDQNVEGPFACTNGAGSTVGHTNGTCPAGYTPLPRWSRGDALSYAVVKDSKFSTVGPYVFNSTVRPHPADFGWEFGMAARVSTLAGELIYASSQSKTICSYDLWDFPGYWSGSGIRWGNVQSVEPALGFYTISPCRVYDSRSQGGPIGHGNARIIPVGGQCGIPLSAQAVALNITSVGPSGAVQVGVFPGDGFDTGTTALAAPSGRTRAGMAVIGLASNSTGTLALKPTFDTGSGQVDLIVDVSGYWAQ